jgi:hypothetical protein
VLIATALISSTGLLHNANIEVSPASINATMTVADSMLASGQHVLGQPRAATTTMGTVTSSLLYLRAGPGATYRIIGQMPRGTKLVILGQQPGWYNVRTPMGYVGWASSRYISLTGTPPQSPSPTPTPQPPPRPTPTPSPTPSPVSGRADITFIDYAPTTGTLDEYVHIRNLDPAPITMTNWTLSDVARTTYTFPPFTLPASGEVRVWTKGGVNDASNLYWGQGRAVWNNTGGDTATLRRSDGSVSDTYTCP